MHELLVKAKDLLRTRAQAYQQVFLSGGIHTDRVLKDLAKFCRANESTYLADSRAHAVLEGRREVWLRIQQHTKLDPDALWKVYGKGVE